jgi:hypothetical protein
LTSSNDGAALYWKAVPKRSYFCRFAEHATFFFDPVFGYCQIGFRSRARGFEVISMGKRGVRNKQEKYTAEKNVFIMIFICHYVFL